MERDAFRLQLCQEFMSSGLTKATFCDKRKVSKSALYRWLTSFKDNPNLIEVDTPSRVLQNAHKASISKQPPEKHNFVRINVEQQAPVQTNNLSALPKASLPPAELVFPNGLRLIINQTINADLVSHLLQAMR